MDALNWVAFTAAAGLTWCVVMFAHRGLVLKRPDDVADKYLIGFFACTAVFIIALLAGGDPGGESVPAVLVGLILGVISAFGIFGGSPPTSPPDH